MRYRVDEDPNGVIAGTDLFALDMDGTIYLGDRWIDGAKDFLEKVKEAGKRFIFLTNNSSKDPGTYVDKLERMGFEADEDMIETSGMAAIDFIRHNLPGKKIFLLGNEMLADEFRREGICLVREGADAVVTAFDTTLDYSKMCIVCDYIRNGLPYIETHPDLNCPTETGYIPDAGAIQAFIKASTGRDPDVIIGKPYGYIVDHMLSRTGSERSKTMMIGDRLYTDVAAGINNGLHGVLVLSGEAGMSDVDSSDVKPDLIFTSLKEMIPFINGI